MKKRMISVLLLAVMTISGCSGQGGTSPTQTPESTPEQSQQVQSTTQAVTESTAPMDEYRDVLKVGLDVDAGPIDSRIATATSTVRIIEQVFDGLVTINENVEPVPCLATSWENPEPTVWIFHLREGVKFHDGSEFTADDVRHTYETILDPDFGASARSQYTSIKEIQVVDDYTIKFILNNPYAPLLAVMDRGILPNWCDDVEDFGNNPVGTGPYKFVEWSKNNRIVVERNDDYWGGPAKTERIEFYIIPDNSTRTAALEAGDIDLIHSPLSPQDVNRMKSNDKFIVHDITSLGVTYLNFNHRGKVMSEKAVRVAISYLLDKETIAYDIYEGMDTPATSVLYPASWAYSDSIPYYEYNPEKAMQGLADAGFEKGTDGFFYRNGEKLVVALSTHSEDPNRIQAVEFIQYTLMSNGIEATVSTNEWATFYSDVQAGNYEICLIGLVGITDPDRYLYQRFHTDAGSNEGGYSNAELDVLLENARASSDQAERAELYRDAAAIINDEVMHNVLLYQGYIAITSNKVEGFLPLPSGSFKGLMNVSIKK